MMSTVPPSMYPTSSPGCRCQPDSTPLGISVRTWTISRPGIEDGRCCTSVRFRTPVNPSDGWGFALGSADIVGPPGGFDGWHRSSRILPASAGPLVRSREFGSVYHDIVERSILGGV